jgi:hypothetical protein
MKLISEEQEIIQAVETLGRYYGYEYDHGRIVIYTNLVKDKITNELIFEKDTLNSEESFEEE